MKSKKTVAVLGAALLLVAGFMILNGNTGSGDQLAAGVGAADNARLAQRPGAGGGGGGTRPEHDSHPSPAEVNAVATRMNSNYESYRVSYASEHPRDVTIRYSDGKVVEVFNLGLSNESTRTLTFLEKFRRSFGGGG